MRRHPQTGGVLLPGSVPGGGARYIYCPPNHAAHVLRIDWDFKRVDTTGVGGLVSLGRVTLFHAFMVLLCFAEVVCCCLVFCSLSIKHIISLSIFLERFETTNQFAMILKGWACDSRQCNLEHFRTMQL